MGIAKTVVRNIASNWVGLLLNLSITFFLSPFVVNTLGSVYYGIWALTMQFTGYMYLLDFGVRDSIIRYTAKYRGLQQPRKLNALLTTALAIYTGTAIIALAVTVCAVAGFPSWFMIPAAHATESRIAVAFVGLTMAQSFVFNAFVGILQGFQRFDVASVVGVVGSVVRALAVLLALNSGYGIVGLSVIQYSLSLAGSLFTTYFALRVLRLERMPFQLVWSGRRRARALFRRIFGYSAYVFINNMAGKIIIGTDAVVVGIFLPVASVTYYAIAGNLIGLQRAMITATVWVMMPLVSHYAALRQFDEVRALLVRASKVALLLALPMCVGFIVVGRQFIALWMGEEYALPASTVLMVLAVAEVVSAPHHAMNAVLLGLGRHRAMAIIRTGEAAVNLLLSVSLVQLIGLPGVALGTAVPNLVVMAVLLPRLTCAIVGLRVGQYFLKAYLGPLVAIFPFAVGALAVRTWWPPSSLVTFFVQMVLLLIPYAAATYVVALSTEERAVVRRSVARLLTTQEKPVNP